MNCHAFEGINGNIDWVKNKQTDKTPEKRKQMLVNEIVTFLGRQLWCDNQAVLWIVKKQTSHSEQQVLCLVNRFVFICLSTAVTFSP